MSDTSWASFEAVFASTKGLLTTQTHPRFASLSNPPFDGEGDLPRKGLLTRRDLDPNRRYCAWIAAGITPVNLPPGYGPVEQWARLGICAPSVITAISMPIGDWPTPREGRSGSEHKRRTYQLRHNEPVDTNSNGMSTNQTDRLIRAKEVAARYDVNVSTVRRWAREGVLPSVRVTKKSIRFRESELPEYNLLVARTVEGLK